MSFDCDKVWAALARGARRIGDFTGREAHDSCGEAFDRPPLLRDPEAGERRRAT